MGPNRGADSGSTVPKVPGNCRTVTVVGDSAAGEGDNGRPRHGQNRAFTAGGKAAAGHDKTAAL